jgi:thiopeptide-type bacteriocin biosynthesis protein
MTEAGDVWIYYKIYPGAAANKMDQLVIRILNRLKHRPDVRRWFFLHYTDDIGPHVRLRAQVPNDSEETCRAVEAIAESALDELATMPPSSYRPVITPQASPIEAERSRPTSIRGVVPENYEPDVETFGPEGVVPAEDLFSSSSVTALQILTHEYRGEYSRKTLVPLVMHAVADAFVPDATGTIWADYAAYWLGWHPQLRDEWLPRFEAKASRLRAQGVAVLTAVTELPPQAVDVLDQWRTATTVAAAQFRSLADRVPQDRRDLTFHFMHTMNNRLGLMPIEEAYYATLIHHELAG